MDKITIGQRIDVYEPIYNAWDDLIEKGGSYVGYLDDEDVQIYHPRAAVAFGYNDFLLMWDFEMKKCGYYLKVKSLKGGNNA